MYRSVDMNGIIVDCNLAYAERMGYTVDEVIGTPLFDHSSADSRKDIRDAFVAWTKMHASNVSVRIQLVTKDGERIDAIRTFKDRYEGDRMVGIDSSIMEFSAIKKMQDLYDVKNRKGYEDPAVMRRSVDYRGTIIECSQSYLDKMGYERDEVIGIVLYEHTAPRSQGNLHVNMHNWRVGHNDAAKIWMRRKDGSEFPTRLVATDETNEDGIIVGRTVSLTPLDA